MTESLGKTLGIWPQGMEMHRHLQPDNKAKKCIAVLLTISRELFSQSLALELPMPK